MRFVLDNSIAMRWLLPAPEAARQAYALGVLDRMSSAQALAPSLFWLEAANVIARAEARGDIGIAQSERFLHLLEGLEIEEHATSGRRAMERVLPLARRFRLSAYDAAYLALALREDVPLATLDDTLAQAAGSAGVAPYPVD